MRNLGLTNRKESFNQIFYLNDDTLLLVSTYNHPTDTQLYGTFRFALFDLKRKKIVKEKEFFPGKGIFMSSYFTDEKVTTFKNKIVFAHPTKPEFYIMNKNLEITDTVFLPVKTKTDSIINKTITDNLILHNLHNPKVIIDYIIEKKIIHLPRIPVVSFINDDLILCSISIPDTVSSDNHLGIKKQNIYIYSLSMEQFIDSLINDTLPFSSLRYSDLSIFTQNGLTYDIISKVDTTTEKINYFLKVYKYIGETSYDIGLPKLKYRIDSLVLYDAYNKRVSIKNGQFKYVIFPDFSLCTHCYQNLKNENILVIVPFNNIEKNILIKKEYSLLFQKSVVLFVKNFPKDIIKNQMYLLRD